MRAGQVIARRYRLEEHIGSGGMGVVWRALDQELGRKVALKRAAPGTGAGGDRIRRRMRREAQIAAELHHPHIVAFIDEVTEGPERWLVLEYVPAPSLAEVLDRAGPLPPGHVTHIGAQIASALEAVHDQGILHRDIKPGNILIAEDGTAKLTDFGISRPIHGDVTVTDSGVISGTVAFLASEVAGGEQPTQASDIFALGATLFAAVEGIPPFGTSDNPLLVLRRAAAGDLLPVRRAGPLAPVLSALLQPDPANRPDAAGARRLLEELATSLNGDEGPTRWPVRGVTRSRCSRRRAVYAAGVVIAIVAIVAGLLVFRPGGMPPNTAPALGDPVMADPCALADPSVLAQFGTATRDSAYGNFNRCDVLVRMKDGAHVDVSVEFESPASPRGTGEGPVPLRVVVVPENDRQCMHIIPLADQNRVTITAELQAGPRPANLCALSGAASDRAVAVLRRGGVPRRGTPPSRESLAWVNACGLLDSGVLTRVLGRGVGASEAGFGNWECRWKSGASGLSAHLIFDRNKPLDPNDENDGKHSELHGHDAYVLAEPDEQDCLARVVNRQDLSAEGNAVDELVKITVRGALRPDQLCVPADQLSEAVAAKLPPAR